MENITITFPRSMAEHIFAALPGIAHAERLKLLSTPHPDPGPVQALFDAIQLVGGGLGKDAGSINTALLSAVHRDGQIAPVQTVIDALDRVAASRSSPPAEKATGPDLDA